MFIKIFVLSFICVKVYSGVYQTNYADKDDMIDIIDLSRPTSWKDIAEYYGAVEKHWKLCLSCGTPSLGTGIHMERPGTANSLIPAHIPVDYLVTRLTIIDISSIARLDPTMVLSLDYALQWAGVKHDPIEPTILLFKFGWEEEDTHTKVRNCVCKIPGISYELASWIAANLSHVVGVATDAPTLESEETREFTRRTVTNLLGKSGIYMIENVNLRRRLPEQGCMAIVMPLKMLNANFVPARIIAYCPAVKTHMHVVLALSRHSGLARKSTNNRLYDVNLQEILHHSV